MKYINYNLFTNIKLMMFDASKNVALYLKFHLSTAYLYYNTLIWP